jgi:hypothetical protein
MFLLSLYYTGRAFLAAPKGERDTAMLGPIFIALINFFIIKSIFALQDNHPLVFMLLGMVAALAYRVHRQDRSPETADKRRPSLSATRSFSAPVNATAASYTSSKIP